MIDAHQFDRQKFKTVIRYVCGKPEAANLGKVRLHKILYFSDMLHFLRTGRPLTGAEYQKQQFGPTARHLGWALDELRRDGLLSIDRIVEFGVPRFAFGSVGLPVDGDLASDQTELLDEVIRFVCSHSARAISEISHNAAWESAAMGETIPYFTAYLLVPCEVTDEDIAWGVREAEELPVAA